MDKRILFILFVLVGSIVVAIPVNTFLGSSSIAEYVALFTSVSTAIYAILAQPKERTEPLLRIGPELKGHGIGIITGTLSSEPNAELNVWVQNIGYSIAKDIEIKCQLSPDTSIPLKDNGITKISFLTPKDRPFQCQIVLSADINRLLSQQLTIETSYLNEDDKKQKPTKDVYSVKELQ